MTDSTDARFTGLRYDLPLPDTTNAALYVWWWPVKVTQVWQRDGQVYVVVEASYA